MMGFDGMGWDVMSRHVMSCDVMRYDTISCDRVVLHTLYRTQECFILNPCLSSILPPSLIDRTNVFILSSRIDSSVNLNIL